MHIWIIFCICLSNIKTNGGADGSGDGYRADGDVVELFILFRIEKAEKQKH